MLATDEDAVICDFAETYHVLDYRALDVRLAATLAAGLAPDSRIMRKLGGAKLPAGETLLAMTADHLAVIRWYLSEDGAKGRNPPQSVLAALNGGGKRRTGAAAFDSGEAFERARRRILEGAQHGD